MLTCNCRGLVHVYMYFKLWYVYLTFEKYNGNQSFIIVVYFMSAILIIQPNVGRA